MKMLGLITKARRNFVAVKYDRFILGRERPRYFKMLSALTSFSQDILRLSDIFQNRVFHNSVWLLNRLLLFLPSSCHAKDLLHPTVIALEVCRARWRSYGPSSVALRFFQSPHRS